MEDYLTDQQQAELVRGWWKENGLFVVVGVVLGVGGLFGWRWWQEYQLTKAEAASAEYEEFIQAVRTDRINQAVEYLEVLAAEYSSTPYLEQAHLTMAKVHMDRNAPEAAADELRQVVDRGHDPELRHIARLRLARVSLHQGEYDSALEILTENQPSAFTPQYRDARGDAYYAMGRFEDARLEYQQALAEAAPGVLDRAYLQAKLDDLNSGDSPSLGLSGQATAVPGQESSAAAVVAGEQPAASREPE